MSVSPSKNRPIVLANSCTKSSAYFRTLRWQGRRHCPACQYWRKLYRLDDGRFKCAQCHYRFSEWTGTYLERLRIPLHELAHLLYIVYPRRSVVSQSTLRWRLAEDRAKGLYDDSSESI